MTKQKRAISISTELDAAIGSLAMKHNMNYSELVERRLSENKEILNEILRLRELPEDPSSMIKGNLRDFLSKPPRKRKHTKQVAV